MKIDRVKVLLKYHGRCAYCGTEISMQQMQVDHLIPQHPLTRPNTTTSYDSVHSEENLMPSCRSCNNYKNGTGLERWRGQLQRLPQVLSWDNTTFRIAERFDLIKKTEAPVIFYFEKFIAS